MAAVVFICFSVLATIPAVLYGVNNGATVAFILFAAFAAYKTLKVRD